MSQFDKDYFESGEKSNYSGYEWKNHKHLLNYAKEIKDNFNINTALDVGCAKGFFVHAMRSEGIKASGVDISEYAINEAYKLAKGHIIQCDYFGKDYTFGKFDLVTCMDVIEHIPEGEVLDYFIEGIQNSVKIGGHIILRTVFYKQPTDTDPTHVTIKPREWWVRKFEENGMIYDTDKFAEMFNENGLMDYNTMLFKRGV